jgi:hypothetical protein
MKTYVKPTMNMIELRTDERLACCCITGGGGTGGGGTGGGGTGGGGWGRGGSGHGGGGWGHGGGGRGGWGGGGHGGFWGSSTAFTDCATISG